MPRHVAHGGKVSAQLFDRLPGDDVIDIHGAVSRAGVDVALPGAFHRGKVGADQGLQHAVAAVPGKKTNTGLGRVVLNGFTNEFKIRLRMG